MVRQPVAPCSVHLFLLWGTYAAIVTALSFLAGPAHLPESVVWLMGIALGFAALAATLEA